MSFKRTGRIVRALLLAIVPVVAAFGIPTPAQAQQQTDSWAPGDIFVGVGNQFLGAPSDQGRYLVLDPNGNSLGADLNDGVTKPNDTTTGCSVDASTPDGNLWTTGWWSSQLTQFSGFDPHSVISHIDMSSLTPLGYKTTTDANGNTVPVYLYQEFEEDASGNPVLDSNGDAIPLATPVLRTDANGNPIPALICSDPTDPWDVEDSTENCGGAVQSITFAKDGTFYVGSTYGSNHIYHYKQDGTLLGTFNVNSTGNRGVDWVDLAVDQHTIYYTALDDYQIQPMVIRSYDTATAPYAPAGDTPHQLPDIPVEINAGVPFNGIFLRGFRILPPGDGTGGFLVATSDGLFRVGPDGVIVGGYPGPGTQYPGSPAPWSLASSYLAITLTPDGRSFWTASFPSVDVTFDANGNEIDTISQPSQLFEFHIATGALESGPLDIGTSPVEHAGRAVDGMCVKLEYTAATEQPDCTANPMNALCKPLPKCTNTAADNGNPECQIPGAPQITAIVDVQRNQTYSSPATNPVSIINNEYDAVNLQVQATSGITGNPALTYSIITPAACHTPGSLPLGVTQGATTPTATGANLTLSGTLAYNASDCIDDHQDISVTVTNANNKSTTVIFHWYVNDLNMPPVISGPINVSLQHGVPGSITISATDPDLTDTLVFSTLLPSVTQLLSVPVGSATPAPAVAGFTTFGAVAQSPNSPTRTVQLSGTPQLAAGVPCTGAGGACSPVGGVIVTSVYADDGHLHLIPTTQSTLLTVTLLNSPPTFTKQPANQVSKPGVAVTPLQIAATDTNNDTLSYSLTTAPLGLTINSATGVISGVLSSGGTFPVTVTVNDGHGGLASTTFNWSASANSAPVCSAAVASPSSLWPPDHRFVTIAIKGVTDPDGDPTTVKINRILQDEPTVPSGHYDGDGCNGHHHTSGDSYDQWSDNGSGNTSIDGIISGPNMSVAQVRAERDGTSDGRVYQILFTASDPSGATCTGSVTVGVPHDQSGAPAVDSLVRYDSTVAGGAPLQGPGFNLPPVYTNPGDQATSIGKVVTLATTATDRNLDTLTYTAAGLPTGLAVKSTTGAISGTPTTAGTFTVTLTASDPYGGVGSVTFKWTIVPNRPPVAVSDTVSMYQGGSITVSVLANDSDPDGDTLKIISISGTYNGTATITGNGTTIYYRPTSNFIGTTQFAYTISDGRGGTATATLRVNVAVQHFEGDGCDHDKHRNGHYDGDGCDHDRQCPPHKH